MLRRLLSSLVVSAFLIACADEKSSQVPPTAPQAVDGPRASVMANTGATEGSSSVCVAYATRRDAARAALASAPADAKLQEKVTSLEAIVADVCN